MTPPLTAPWDWRRPAIWGALAVNVICVLLLLPILDRFGFDGVTSERQGEAVVFRLSPLWLVFLSLPVGLMVICALAGLTLPAGESRVTGGVFLFYAITVTVAAFPTIWTSQLTVTPSGFSHTRGGWWAPELQTVRFDSISTIAVVGNADVGRGHSFRLECRGRNGELIGIPSSTVMKAGLPTILAQATRSGIEITAEPDDPDTRPR